MYGFGQKALDLSQHALEGGGREDGATDCAVGGAGSGFDGPLFEI